MLEPQILSAIVAGYAVLCLKTVVGYRLNWMGETVDGGPTPPSLPHPHSPPCGNSRRALLRGSGPVGGPSGAGCTCPQRRVLNSLLCWEHEPPRRAAPEQNKNNPEEPPPEIRITQDGSYYARIKDVWHEAELSYLGTLIIGERLTIMPLQI
eukprot:scaffold86829_cov33-Tisochrysis_lutea.AAC.4